MITLLFHSLPILQAGIIIALSANPPIAIFVIHSDVHLHNISNPKIPDVQNS